MTTASKTLLREAGPTAGGCASSPLPRAACCGCRYSRAPSRTRGAATDGPRSPFLPPRAHKLALCCPSVPCFQRLVFFSALRALVSKDTNRFDCVVSVTGIGQGLPHGQHHLEQLSRGEGIQEDGEAPALVPGGRVASRDGRCPTLPLCLETPACSG
jgi:hypothetical protein